MKISIVAPMYNEKDNLVSSYTKIVDELKVSQIKNYEIIFVNDGSTDGTWGKALRLSEDNSNLKIIGYTINQGRGKAIRTGIDAASGDIICTIDFDLSYDAPHITKMITELKNNSLIDVILTSCYMPGGNTIGVPAFRLLISKTANLLYRFAFTPQIYTSTCVVRAYRKDAIKSLDLESDDKEIHLEIISKLLANNFKIKEIPGTLKRRTLGASNFKFASHSISHILFFVQERPFALFGIVGLFLFFLGLFSSVVLTINRLGLIENASDSILFKITSPSFVLIIFLTSFQIMSVGFIGIQNNNLKKELFKIQSKLKKK